MNKCKMVVAYDGTDFEGWQTQPHKKTIVDLLEERFLKIFGEKVSILGASRTDSGVHATGQVASCMSALTLPPHTIQKAWNNMLPPSISIRSLEVAPPRFHPHAQVDYKIYYYHLFLERPLPFVARYGWHYPFIHAVDKEKLYAALKLFEGEHDFRAFSKLDEDKSTVRKIDRIGMRMLPRYKALQIVIVGKSFLHFQIRRMIGSALDVARQETSSLDLIRRMLTHPVPERGGLKAESKGLLLRKIKYL